mgnify:CR=1 FL=1
MFPIVCPTCRTELANKQIYYFDALEKICRDQEMGVYKTTEEADLAKAKILDDLFVDKICCRMRILTTIRPVLIVK